MKLTRKLWLVAILMVVLVPAGVGQEEKKDTKKDAKPDSTAEAQAPEAERGMIEFGVRHFWGDVYGRPDLPFTPNLRTSKLNEYSDLRNNFFIRRARVNI